jgi:hypothetical protein
VKTAKMKRSVYTDEESGEQNGRRKAGTEPLCQNKTVSVYYDDFCARVYYGGGDNDYARFR